MVRTAPPASLHARAAMHAALGDPVRLAVVDQLVLSDRSPVELTELLGVTSSLLAHHLAVLSDAGLITRTVSAGDGRRKYVRLERAALGSLRIGAVAPRRNMLFLCSHNSARSQLAAALWTARTGGASSSAGTHPADHVHRGALAAARRAGLDLDKAAPRLVGAIPAGTQVVTVCDRAHEELTASPDWWHWSIPDPVEEGTAAAFNRVVAELDHRIAAVHPAITHHQGTSA